MGHYKDVLPSIPGTSMQMKGQAARAMDTVREMALEQADPTGNIVQAGAGRNPSQTISSLKDAFDKEYADTVKNYTFPCRQTSGIRWRPASKPQCRT